MNKFYFNQLVDYYPEKAEMLNWLKDKLDEHIYYYGPNFKYPHGVKASISFKNRLIKLYVQLFPSIYCYYGAVISNAYFNVGKIIRDKGFNVLPPPWTTSQLTKYGSRTIKMIDNTNFCSLISDDFCSRLYDLKEEFKSFFVKNRTPFVLLSNDVAPLHRIVIDACKEIGVPTGIFLHGLPARYNAVDDARADYLFVWGDKIKDIYLSYGCKSKIVVTGHPSFSSFEVDHNNSREIVVLSQAISGSQSQSDKYRMEDRGLSVQYIYSVEKVLKKLGFNSAILRIHPSENPSWYEAIMDNSFYTIDKNPLKTTLHDAKFVIGPISTVILDAVFSGIPYYSYIIDPKTNPYAYDIVPPFNNTIFPTSYSETGLEDKINTKNYVKKEHFDGYINPFFEASKIIDCFKESGNNL